MAFHRMITDNNKEHVIMKPLEINPSLNVSVEVERAGPETSDLYSFTGSIEVELL